MNTENEILVILMEECAEVIQAASKIVRFGPDSEWEGQTAAQSLEKELGDLWCMIDLLHAHDMVSFEKLEEYSNQKYEKLKKWSNIEGL